MPPFRLEATEKFVQKRTKTTLYSKKNYSPGVKVSGWESYSESLPIDVNPYDPNDFDTLYSHYHRLGVDDKINYTSVTHEMLEQLSERRRDLEVDPHKAFINLYSEIDNVICSDIDVIRMCSSPFSQDYRTTMQHHYQPPFPNRVERLSAPPTPYYLNRRLRNTGLCKFLDDDYTLQTKRLQKYKVSRSNSYNPGTAEYTLIQKK